MYENEEEQVLEKNVNKKKIDKKLAIKITIAVLALLLIPIIIVSGYYVRKRNINNKANKKEAAVTETVVDYDKDAPEAKTTDKDVIEPKKKVEAKAPVTDYPYELYVNATQNVVTAYKRDSKGNYTVPIRAMRCTTGKAGTRTPRGIFKTKQKYLWKILMGDIYGQYSTRIVGGVLFHSVTYEKPQKNLLMLGEYNKLGRADSHGCVRLTTEDAKWIYDNCPLGTVVRIYDSNKPEPLGRGFSYRIRVTRPRPRGWDPTDPDPANPYNKFSKTDTNPANPWLNITNLPTPPTTTTTTTTTKPTTTTTKPTTTTTTTTTTKPSTTETTTSTTTTP